MTEAFGAFDAVARALEARSVELLCGMQAERGAFPAGPSVVAYRFCWFRDGSFIARALDVHGRSDRAVAFHRWAARVLHREGPAIRDIVARRQAGVELHPSALLPTRYTLDGDREAISLDDLWPNFQLDGYGTWLWALARHLRPAAGVERDADSDNGGDGFEGAARLAADYLAACWELPCFDWWEEFGDRQHTATLASVAAGLRAASVLLNDSSYADVADRVLERIMTACVRDGRFVKGPSDDRVDASLLTMAIPFELVPVTDPVFASTAQRIADDLQTERGGVCRYVGDTFFGGGPWVLLTCWLGAYYVSVGDLAGYERCERWVLETCGGDLTLPEQVVAEAQFPDWASKWLEGGPPADPLLWSHAAYLLMRQYAANGLGVTRPANPGSSAAACPGYR